VIRPDAARAARALTAVAERRGAASAAGVFDLPPEGFEALAVALARHRVLPLLGARALALAPAAPGAFATLVEEATTTARRLGALHGMVLERVLALLDGAGIPALPLKGVPLAERLHGDAALRESADIDVLVARERFPAAVRALEAAGSELRDEWCDARGLPMLHRSLVAPGLPAVEIHWRIHWYEERSSAELLERSVPDERWGRRPDPVDEGLSLLLFHARDGLGGLRLPADVAAWWDGAGHALDGGAIAERAQRHPALSRALTAAWDALEPAIGLPPRPWPARPSARTRLATRLADPDLETDPDQIAAERSLVDGLLSPRSGLRRYARRTLVVPLDTMRERAARAGAGQGTARLRLAQAAVPAQVLPRFALAFRRRRGADEL
jgi:Uncharacterised nucleotidyltransferase